MKAFLRDWMLIIAILSGVAAYFIYVSIPWLDSTHDFVADAVGIIQPVLIFIMLFLTFCRVNPKEMRLNKWHLWLLLMQGGLFVGIGCVLAGMPQGSLRVILEGAMICLICPTATAAAVVTRKLGGDVNSVTSYTILVNLLCAVLIPVMIPFVHPHPEMSVLKSALIIMAKVFPLLLMPFLCAIGLRRISPALTAKIGAHSDLAFYIWAFSLALAIAVTTRSIVHCTLDLSTELWLVAVSLICCLFQFWFGRKIGRKYGDHITSGQAMGQKNTVLAIWMGTTFFTPVTAIVGGFYSIWHNLANSWQLYHHRHPGKQARTEYSK
ncbi:MAG: transporter [Muribaculaceae bacterium]|nr:transporter [Muribaculaceae bacterium]